MNTPKDLIYQDTDEWVKSDNSEVIIGISDYAQDQLSDIVFIEFNNSEGDLVQKGDVIATIESVKAAGDVLSPVSGTVKAVNEALEEKPETLNDDPYEAGWLFKIKMSNVDELKALMSADDYEKYCQERE